LQGTLLNHNPDNDYTFRFTPAAFWTCLSFYASQIFLIPYAGLALIALPLVIRDRRLWFGAAMLFLFFVPCSFCPAASSRPTAICLWPDSPSWRRPSPRSRVSRLW